MNKKVVYRPNFYVSQGFFERWRSAVEELRASQELGVRLFLRDVRARYQQQVLGVLWILISPLIIAFGFYALRLGGILGGGVPDDGKKALVSGYLGFVIWQLAQAIVSNSSSSVINNSGLLGKINFPRFAILYSPVMLAVVDFFVRFSIAALLAGVMGLVSWSGVCLGLLALIPTVVLSVGLGMALSIAGAVIRDLGNMLTHLFFALMLVTPIFYEAPEQGLLAELTRWNVFNYLIVVPRDIMIGETASLGQGYAMSALAAFVVFLTGIRLFRIALHKIIEKI